jgi:hypothetical protein
MSPGTRGILSRTTTGQSWVSGLKTEHGCEPREFGMELLWLQEEGDASASTYRLLYEPVRCPNLVELAAGDGLASPHPAHITYSMDHGCRKRQGCVTTKCFSEPPQSLVGFRLMGMVEECSGQQTSCILSEVIPFENVCE